MPARSVVVVGAGAAGLTAAIRAAESGARVTLLNAHPRIGLKILMSGGTRCNVTHREVAATDYFGGSRHVIARILRAFTPEQTREWFETLGVALKLEETGKYFPVTDDAQTVLDALLRECSRVGVELRAGARVTHIDVVGERSKGERSAAGTAPDAAGTRFRLGIQPVKDAAAFSGATPPAPAEFLEAGAVILATGGLSFPRTGSDGTGYALARSLGHTIVPTIPALTPLTSEEPWCMMLKGLAFDAELTLRLDDRIEAVTRGSLLLTHFGYSGPAALDLSRHWLRAEGRGAIAVTLNAMPGETRESLERAWLAAAKDARLTVRRHLGARLPDRLAVTLCAEAGVGPSLKAGQVPRERRRDLIERVVARPLRISGTLGYEKAEVTAGGVALDEVNPSTLESRRCPRLYLCGEILDVEGRLGGFNFQFSWSSGTVAGTSVTST